MASFYEISPSASATASFTVADRLVNGPPCGVTIRNEEENTSKRALSPRRVARRPLARLPPLVHRQAADK
jgi:hypothetical protein